MCTEQVQPENDSTHLITERAGYFIRSDIVDQWALNAAVPEDVDQWFKQHAQFRKVKTSTSLGSDSVKNEVKRLIGKEGRRLDLYVPLVTAAEICRFIELIPVLESFRSSDPKETLSALFSRAHDANPQPRRKGSKAAEASTVNGAPDHELNVPIATPSTVRTNRTLTQTRLTARQDIPIFGAFTVFNFNRHARYSQQDIHRTKSIRRGFAQTSSASPRSVDARDLLRSLVELSKRKEKTSLPPSLELSRTWNLLRRPPAAPGLEPNAVLHAGHRPRAHYH